MSKFAIDRTTLPYDAMVGDHSWFIPIEEDGDSSGDEKTEEVQTDQVQSKGQPV